ncbi:MAG: O-antigen ligase family protein [Anaerolineae bacterium]
MISGTLLIARERARVRTRTLFYTPLTGEADWDGAWELSARGADPSQEGSLAGTDRVTIPFTGNALALRVRRGNYRAYFWIRVDGEPANRLPQTEQGAYLVLSSPDYEPETTTIPVAGGLKDGPHVAEIVADRGWDQWPLSGWRVRRGPDPTVFEHALAGLAAGVATCLAGIIGWRATRPTDQGAEEEAPNHAASPPFGTDLVPLHSAISSPVSLVVVAGIFYSSPWLPLTLVSGVALAGLVVLRLDLGLALVALSTPFYLHPRPLLGKSFSMTEILILLCMLSWGLRQMVALRSTRSLAWSPSSADRAVLLLVLVTAGSTLFADRRHVALRELRVVIVEPVLFYVMLRTSNLREVVRWRIVDGFIAGATIVALIGLVQYGLGTNVITAEQGFPRLRSVYGSPNNAALYLGRALPVLLAVAALSATRRRRLIYALFAAPVALATLLSFSRAAILLGIPLSLLTLGVLAGGRWRWVALGLMLVAALGVVPLLGTPRFAGLLNPHSGTLFFRLQLWQASWRMFVDHPWLGVGPDNFLYQYRGRYILPSAWQEPHLSHAHNLLLSYATRLGLPGMVVGLWLQAAFWRRGLSLRLDSGGDRRALAIGLMGSMAYAVAHGLVDASFFFVDLALSFLLVLGLVQSLKGNTTNEQENQP